MKPARFFSIIFSAAALFGATALGTASANQLPLIWEVAAAERVDSTPAIAPNGNVYATMSGNRGFGDISGGKLVCVNSNGIRRWTFLTRCDIRSSPAIGDDGTIYFGARDRKLYAISPAGKPLWAFTTGAWVDATPAISTDGVIYCGSWDQKFYALNPNGTKRWEFATGGPVDSSAAIANDGTIYFGSHDKKLYAVKADGSLKWAFATEGPVVSSPALNCDGTIYFTSVDGRLYALNADGTRKWAVWLGGVNAASPVLDAKGNIFIGVNDTFQALNPDGTKTWWFGYPIIDGSAAISSDGTIYFCGNNQGPGILFGFNPDGQERTYTRVSGSVIASPVIGRDGMLYIGGGSLQAFKSGAELAKTCWPKFHGGLRQTGRIEE